MQIQFGSDAPISISGNSLRFNARRHIRCNSDARTGRTPENCLSDSFTRMLAYLSLHIYSPVLPAMQDQAAEKLDQLLLPIEVSDEIKKLGEKQSMYVASVAKGAQIGE